MTAFLYPARQHIRRHGPQGYADPRSYRPWLRDEFSFRCVFCLRREQWDRSTSIQVDHFAPTALFPEARLEYENLLYACARCNEAKGAQIVADPTSVFLSSALEVSDDGQIIALTAEARRLVRQLRLDSPELTHFRRLWIEVIALARRYDPALLERLLGFPNDLPDLSALRPPGGNDRPHGIEESAYSLRVHGQLPAIY